MAKVTDEMLMAYADGALNPLARAKVEAFLQSHPEARRSVGMFRATGAPLSALYGQPIEEPVPAYLKDFVLNYPLKTGSPEAQPLKERPSGWLQGVGVGTRGFAANLVEWLQAPASARRWQLAVASTAFLALVLGAAALLHDDSGPIDLVAFNDGRIYASGPLSDVLDKELSGHEARIGGVRGEAVTMRANLTFKSKQNSYCRQYEVATPSDGGFAGLGCRGIDGKWVVEAYLPKGKSAKSGGIKTASGADSAALDGIVDRMIDGIVFGAAEETSAIRNGWK